jgi:hypothetical protein
VSAPAWPGVLALAVALLLWSPPARLAADRVRALRRPSWELARVPDGQDAAARRRWLLAGAAGLAVGLLVGGITGVVVGAGVALAGGRWLRSPGGDGGREGGTELVRELPAACDLLAVCLSAGLPVGTALAAVGAAVPGPLGPHLTAVAALSRLGAEPRTAWAASPGELGALGRVLVRAGESGATAAPALRALASDGRATLRAEADAAVRRAGVWVLAPLGVCFLPAFVCLGVAPMVLGIAADVFR